MTPKEYNELYNIVDIKLIEILKKYNINMCFFNDNREKTEPDILYKVLDEYRICRRDQKLKDLGI